MEMRVPFVDLGRSWREDREAISQALAEVIEEQAFILGPAVERFERAVAEAIGVRHAVGGRLGHRRAGAGAHGPWGSAPATRW